MAVGCEATPRLWWNHADADLFGVQDEAGYKLTWKA